MAQSLWGSWLLVVALAVSQANSCEYSLSAYTMTAADLSRVREVGYGDGEIVEIIANVALNIFTNYLHNVARPEVDFPKIDVTIKPSD